MRRSIPDHGSRKLPVINALDGAITINKEIDLEEEYQVSHQEGTDSEADCESSAPSPARAQGSTGGAGGETKRKAGTEGDDFSEPTRSGSARRADSQSGPADGGSRFGRPMEPLLHFGFARGDAKRGAATDDGGRSRRVLPGLTAGTGGDGSGDALPLGAGSHRR